MKNTRVKDVMTRNPQIIDPISTIDDAARIMKETNCGILPVGSNDNLVGMVSDRDMVVNALAKSADCSDTKVEDVMRPEVFSVHEDDSLQQAADRMAQHKVGRLIVLDKNGNVSGILSFGGIVRNVSDKQLIGEVLEHATSKVA